MIENLDEYMALARQYPLLNPEEEVKLAKKIEKGSDYAREKLAASNLRLVAKIVNEYRGKGLSLEDLIGHGKIGLMEAVEKFRAGRGAKFSSYSAWWIKREIKRALEKENRGVGLPFKFRQKAFRVYEAKKKLKEKLGREASYREIAKDLGYALYTVIGILNGWGGLKRLEQEDRSHQEMLENIPDEKESPMHTELKEYVRKLVLRLDERKRKVLEMFFGLDGKEYTQSLVEAGKVIGRTRARAGQLKDEAIEELKEMMRNDGTYKEWGY